MEDSLHSAAHELGKERAHCMKSWSDTLVVMNNPGDKNERLEGSTFSLSGSYISVEHLRAQSSSLSSLPRSRNLRKGYCFSFRAKQTCKRRERRRSCTATPAEAELG